MMDLVRVDPTTWLPIGAPITHYSALIWTEKFFERSEFELTTPAVHHTMGLLPQGTLVTLRQSKEVMRVSKLTITTDDQDREVLKVTGKSLTSYISHRVLGEKRNVKYQAMNASNLGSGLIILYNSFVNTQAWDLTTGLAATYKNPKDAIPNVAITDSTGEIFAGTSGAAQQRWLDPGYIDTPLLNFFSERPYGLRVLRPKNTTYKIAVATNRVITATWTEDIPELCFDVFAGTDRSYEQVAVAPVIFDTEIDDLIRPNYLLSEELLKTEVHISLNDKALFARSADLSGLERRVLFLDGGDPEEGYNATAWEAYNVKLAEGLLEDNKSVVMIDGEVSPQSKLKYERDYFLGDYVSVRGRYGAIAKARVSEYIRAYGEQGEVSYPSLVYT